MLRNPPLAMRLQSESVMVNARCIVDHDLSHALVQARACLSALRSAHNLPVAAIGHELVAASTIGLRLPNASYDHRTRALFTAKILEAESAQTMEPDRRDDFLSRCEALLDRLEATAKSKLAS